MITKPSKNLVRKRIHKRVRKNITGTNERPRLNVFRSNKNIYAQLIDDTKGITIVSANTNEKDLDLASSSNTEAAEQIGKLIAEQIGRASCRERVKITIEEVAVKTKSKKEQRRE